MDGQDQSPIVPVHSLVMFFRRFLGYRPKPFQVGGAGRWVPRHRDCEHRSPVFPSQRDPGWGLDGCHGHRHVGLLERAQLEQAFVKFKPIAFIGDGLGLGEQPQDYPQRLVHAFPLCLVGDSHHVGVAGQGTRPDPKQHPAVGHVVKLHHAVGDHQRVMVRQAHDAGAQFDVTGPLGRGGDEDLRRGDDFPSRRMVLADPGFIETQGVHPVDQLQVAVQGQCWVLSDPMKRPHEGTEFHPFRHIHLVLPSELCLLPPVVAAVSDHRRQEADVDRQAVCLVYSQSRLNPNN